MTGQADAPACPVDPILRDALERLADQARGNRHAHEALAMFYEAAGALADAAEHRSALATIGADADDLRQAEELRRLAEASQARLLAGEATDLAPTDLWQMWGRVHASEQAARRHRPVAAIELVTVAAELVRALPGLVAGGRPEATDSSIRTTEDLFAWISGRIRARLELAASEGDDPGAAVAVASWVRFSRAFAVDIPVRTGSQFIVVPAELLEDLAGIVALALRIGRRSAAAATYGLDELVTGERGYVTRQLTAAQTWSAVVTRVAAATHQAGDSPVWWTTERLADRIAAATMSCCRWGVALWEPTYELVTAPSAERLHDPGAGLRSVPDDVVAGLAEGEVLSFVITPEQRSSGVCAWPPTGPEELRGPRPAPPVPAAAQRLAEALGVPVRSVFDLEGYAFNPAPLLPGLGFAAPSIPHRSFWHQRAEEVGVTVDTIAGTLSRHGLQLLLGLSDRAALDVEAAPWLGVLAPMPDDID